jgi:anti-sigma-K factor RskA
MNHQQATELLAALALDAVDEREREELEAHVNECPKCRSELDGYMDVAAALGNSVEPLPDGLWNSISSRIYDTDEEPLSSPVLATAIVPLEVAAVRRRRTRFATRPLLASMGTVAAAIIVVLAISVSNTSSHVSKLQRQLADSNYNVAAALSTPGHTLVDLESSSKKDLAQFVLLPDGRGYLVNSELPALDSNRTYQLWGLINGTPISIGLMGSDPTKVAFTVSGAKPSVLGVTVEPSGGSPKPTNAMIASGTFAD